jgi:pimeloyl-ACP methyl ester carboxylesterase
VIVPEASRQFHVLFRMFFSRAVDLELVSSGEGLEKLATQFAAILAAFNFVVVYVLAPGYSTSTLPEATLQVNAWSAEEFLISTTISVVGLFIVLAWDNLLPDLRDSFVLRALPVRTRTIALAKVSALACAVGAIVFCVNLFTSFCYAGVVAGNAGTIALLRAFATYWMTMGVAAVFTVALFIGIQGLAAQLLNYRSFLRFSGLIQLTAFFGILALYFLKPHLATVAGLTDPQYRFWWNWLPSYWFLGLFQELNFSPFPWFRRLAIHGLWVTVGAVSVAGAALALAYVRTMKKMLEQPDISPRDRRRHASRVIATLVGLVWTLPLDRAMFLFSLRTLTRSPKHRLLLAMYGGIGLAIALAYTESLLHGGWNAKWTQTNAPLLVASLVLLFFTVFGMRIVFTFPHALACNWTFRVTAVQRPARYFFAVRKSLYALAALPLLALATLFLLAIWPGRPVLLHLGVLVAVAIILVERSLQGFRKIPFACSYLPGKANLNVTLGLYAAVILFAAHQGGLLEFWAMKRPARYIVLLSVLLFWAVRARCVFHQLATAPSSPLQFEDRPPNEVLTLDFRQDGELLGEEVYVEAERPGRLRRRLLLLSSVVFVLLLCGMVYERIAEWHDRKLAPQVGKSVDIGGRSLNLYCSGEGSPTVIFESNWGSPGYSWLHVQREVAKFTRACWYDRAGYGWSEPGPFPNHSDSMARDLQSLLTHADISPPYVLAAHALGSFAARVFRGFYPGEVAGLVLVDPTSEDLTIHIHNHIELFRPAVLLLHHVMGGVGFMRLIKPDSGSPTGGFTDEEWRTLSILKWQTKSLVAEGKEPPNWINGEQARAAGAFGDIPLIVLSAGIQDREEDSKLDHNHVLKLELQHQLAALSARGIQRIVNSGHRMHFDSPASVIAAIQEVVQMARNSSPQ